MIDETEEHKEGDGEDETCDCGDARAALVGPVAY